MSATSISLYQIETELMALLDTEQLVPAEQEQEFREALAIALKTAVDKRQRVAEFRATLIAQQDFAAAEIKRLQERKRRFENAQDRLDGYIKFAMQSNGVRKLEANTSTFSLRACPDSVEITDEKLVPAKFKTVRIETVLSKAEIKKALQAGEDVPGADLKIGGQTLVVR